MSNTTDRDALSESEVDELIDDVLSGAKSVDEAVAKVRAQPSFSETLLRLVLPQDVYRRVRHAAGGSSWSTNRRVVVR